MKRTFSRRLGLVVGALLLLWVQVAAALSYYEPSPQGTIGLSRPVISQKLELAPGERITAAEMWIDNRVVYPSWDANGRVYYRPPQPLPLGPHDVRLVVRVSPDKPGYYFAPVESQFTFTVDGGAVAELSPPGLEALRALDWVNQYRKAADLAPLVYDDRLAAAAVGHARYLDANPNQVDSDGHRESPSQPLFIGETVGERARYYAYDGGSFEVINFVARAEDAVDGWMDTLYHRIPLIHPGMTVLGYGVAGEAGRNVNVVQTGPYDRADAVVRWPYPGQTGVPPLWDGLESPDPLALYPNAATPVGYPITLTFGAQPRALRLTSWTLSGPGGEVPAHRFDPENDPHLDDTVSLIPEAPLRPDTAYTVRMRGQIDLGEGVKPFDYTWSFTTASEYRPILRSRVAVTANNELRSVRVEGNGFEPGLQVFLGGLPVVGLEVQAETRFTFRPPTGYRGEAADLLVVTPGGVEVQWREFFKGDEPYIIRTAEPLTPLPLLVRGQYLAQPALVHQSGAILLPEEALVKLGALPERIGEIHRSYWKLGEQQGDYTLGRVSADVTGVGVRLGLPVQRRQGATYVEAVFARGLAQVETQAIVGELFVGSRIMGILDIEGHWGLPAMERLLKAEIVSGYGDGSFRPNAPLSRAAFVKMLVGARGLEPRPGDAGSMGDTASHWVSDQGYLGAAVAASIVKPAEYPGLRFEPDRSITREEIAVMVARALGLEQQAMARKVEQVNGAATLGERTFSDAGAWTRPGYIAVAVEAGIITGYAEADRRYTFQPTRSATRAEAAVMVVRALER